MIVSFFRRVFGVLLSQGFWVFIGLLVVSALIWLVGPLFALGDWRPLVSVEARLWSIGGLILLVLLRVLFRRWTRRNTNRGIAENLKGMLQFRRSEERNDEVKLLNERFDEALDILRRARFVSGKGRWLERLFKGGRYLYELPWYIIIGAPGVGKTTALLNSGLQFPLEKPHGKGAIKGAGGTRNCDWWFTNEAVLIDTAGRYTTHESDAQVDNVEWRGFLKLLRKSRASQPINGVLLAVSVTELLDASPDQRRAHAKVLRERLDEVRNGLEIAFPVYLIVNKCDLMSGFDEYFSALDRAGREQVWGFTLPWQGAAQATYDSEAIEAEIGLLKSRLHVGLVDVLQSEPELGRRALIHSFPQQFALLCEALDDLLEMLFADSRFSRAPMIRGVYFTSATQEGTPLDRVIGSMGMPPLARGSRGTAKTYFLNELLTRVVFAEAHLAGHNSRVNQRSRAIHIGAYALSALILACTLGAWANSYRKNLGYLAEVDGKVDRLGAKLIDLPPVVDGNLYALLAPLTEAETAADSVHFRAAAPLMPWTFGLYQGDKLLAGSRPLYENLLRTRLAPAIDARLAWLLRTVAVEDLEFSYEILRAYLMLHEREHFDADAFKSFVLADWDYNMPEGAAGQEREALERHLSALIATGDLFPKTGADSTLVASTRARLMQHSFAHRAYHRLLRTLEEHKLPDFSVGGVIGPNAPSVFRRISGKPLTDGIPALYTYRGYHELFGPAVGNVMRVAGKDDVWVLGVSQQEEQARARAIVSGELELEVKRLYMWDYVAQWARFIDDVDIVQPANLSEATELLQLLSSSDSPLARLLKAIVTETTLLKVDKKGAGSDQSLLERVKRTARATQDDVTRIVGPSMMPGRLGPNERPELIVDNRFEALRRSVGNGETGGPMAATIQSLSELHLLLRSVEAAKAGGYAPPKSDLPAKLLAEAGRLPPPSRRLIEALANAGTTLVAREARVAKGQQLVGSVTRACRETIAGRYPFAAGAEREVAVGDFARMFGPGGTIDSYFERELASSVDTSVTPWRLLPSTQGGLGGSSALGEFEKASVIKEVFFRSGAGVPTVTVLIKPIEMDPTITNLVLDVDGQVIRYQHGPQVGHTVRWPGTKGSNQIRLAIEPALVGGTSGMLLEGPWAMHRLLDKARISPAGSSERFRAVLDIGGRKATFEITTSSAKNPFVLQELRSFTCPEGL